MQAQLPRGRNHLAAGPAANPEHSNGCHPWHAACTDYSLNLRPAMT